MGNLVNVESSTYVSGVIEKYAQNKVGQYSKYLNLTPTFITYYSVNQIMSRTDVGTGSVASERGYESPLRFNKIKGLPAYNLPVLSPDIMYDESGMDIELEINDMTLLPNTVKPTVPDYFCIEFSNGNKLLFRVNNFKFNTIQSNDFITISADIKAVGPDADKSIESLVVKTYYTVFDNIGTEDKCFIEEERIPALNNLVKTIKEYIDTYKDLYWDHVNGGYVLTSSSDSMKGIYDVFLTRFINETDIFPHPSTRMTTVPYLDYVPPGSDLLYKRSLLYGIQGRTKRYLAHNMYYFLADIANPFSPFKTNHYECLSVHPMIIENPVLNTTDIKSYYDSLLIKSVLYGDSFYPTIPVIIDPIPTEPVIPPVTPESVATSTIEDEFESNITPIIPKGELTQEEKDLISRYTDDQKYVFDMILHYMMNLPFEIDPDKIVSVVLTKGRFSYFYTPLIIYVLMKYYNQYFNSPNT